MSANIADTKSLNQKNLARTKTESILAVLGAAAAFAAIGAATAPTLPLVAIGAGLFGLAAGGFANAKWDKLR